MSDFPRLAQLGITDPATITGYAINSINQVDVLRIAQLRERGSFLPTRRSWEFPRVQVGSPTEEGTPMVTAPVLKEIKAELDELFSGRRHKEMTVAALREELRALEAEVEMRIQNMQDALARLEEL